MALLKLGLAGINQIPMDWPGNIARIRDAWAEARKRDVRVLVFPELALSGYGCEDMFLHPDTGKRALRHAAQLARDVEDEVLIIGLPVHVDNVLHNGLAVLNRGKIRGINLKSHLAREGIHYEPRWFQAWPLGNRDRISVGDDTIPVGTLTYRAGGLSFGLEICEDAWVSSAQRPCAFMPYCEWIFNASASHFSMHKADTRERIVRESSAYFGVGYAYTNLVGCESGRAIYDGELLVAERGEIVNRGDRLYLDDFMLLTHDIHHEPSTGEDHIALQIAERLPPTRTSPRVTARQHTSLEEEFTRAATLALFDYMRKSRMRGFTLSLSGGVDSGAVAVLVWLTACRIIEELGPEVRRGKLAYFDGLDLDTNDPRTLTRQLLTTVYQATRNSGEVTRGAASELAKAVGAHHLELDVDPLVEGYRETISKALGRELSWETDDIALQNIQARVRAPSVWMLTNLKGSLLLSTSNRSEVAVGYATMDGDTAGGLAPIAGVEKSFLQQWMRIMERDGLPGFSPLPELHYINAQEPTAELRPPQDEQKDEDDLMPYEVLDALEEALVSLRLTPREARDRLLEKIGKAYSRDQLTAWTRKFCRMFAVSQWKRERYAPSFHLDDSSLDPKTWARYPILNGAFGEELEEL
jgi:NAD+ synthase (glutamine-hydrolysing)